MPTLYSNPALAKDALVVVSGANGFIGSHIVEEALAAGLRVRGTVRNRERSKWLTELFEPKYGKDRFELVVVQDIGATGAFDQAVKGASGFVHCASDVSFDKDPNKVIPYVVAAMKSSLASAAKEPTMKRFVYTSSSTAAWSPKPNLKIELTTESWNDEVVEQAWKEPYDDEGHEWATYGASKTTGEKAAWEFMDEHKPGFVLNTVLPSCNFGSALHESHTSASTSKFLTQLWSGEAGMLPYLPPHYFVDVSDDAKLHIAALLNPDVKGERLFGYAEPFNYNDLVKTLRKLHPDHKFPDEIDGIGRDMSTVPNGRAEELLKPFGLEGWTRLEASLKANTALLAKQAV